MLLYYFYGKDKEEQVSKRFLSGVMPETLSVRTSVEHDNSQHFNSVGKCSTVKYLFPSVLTEKNKYGAIRLTLETLQMSQLKASI